MVASSKNVGGKGGVMKTTEDERLSLRLCEALSRWRYEDLPPEVLSSAKHFMIDTLGVIAGAANAPGIDVLNRRLARWEQIGTATGLLGKRRYSPPNAALANGTAAHALEFDDMHDAARVHGYCTVLPSVLATAEDRQRVNGREFLLAIVTGAELNARLGLACYDTINQGWHPTCIFGIMAGAVAAGRVLGLDSEGLLNALAIAYHQSGGTLESADGVLSKRLGPGFAARSGVLSAFLAADGMTGARRPIEGKAGMLALYQRGQVRAEKLTEGLGKDWQLLDYCYKPFPSGRINHNPIVLAIELRNAGVRHEDVEKATIYLARVNKEVVGKPYAPAENPTIDAQFNACYSFARALIDGRVDLSSYTMEKVLDPEVLALASLTVVEEQPGIDPRAMPYTRVKVLLKDGRTLERKREVMKGSREDPLSDAEVMAKLQHCMSFGLRATQADAERVWDVIMNLERHDDAAQAIVSAFPK
jgi:2-methylcitrate dehydratase PrpD